MVIITYVFALRGLNTNVNRHQWAQHPPVHSLHNYFFYTWKYPPWDRVSYETFVDRRYTKPTKLTVQINFLRNKQNLSRSHFRAPTWRSTWAFSMQPPCTRPETQKQTASATSGSLCCSCGHEWM